MFMNVKEKINKGNYFNFAHAYYLLKVWLTIKTQMMIKYFTNDNKMFQQEHK